MDAQDASIADIFVQELRYRAEDSCLFWDFEATVFLLY